MTWERRLRDMTLAGGALVAAACSGSARGGDDGGDLADSAACPAVQPSGGSCADDGPADAAPVDAEAVPSDGPPGGPCTTSSDCDTGEQCLFPIGDCSAKGQCLSLSSLGAECFHEVAYCGCNGTSVGGLCGPPYAYGPTPSPDAASPCAHADAGDASAE